MNNQAALQLVRELGHIFAVALTERTGQSIDDKSDLMNGLAGYEILNLKGQSEALDKAVDIVMRIIYDLVVEKIDNDQIKIGKL